ncbi:hypothetical protein CVT26_002935 [Gymnopilus dilepis]|uniref:Uncharacterized protein n=1 Tax=Gymnopilus dilepis TaxID=231916 RepID=A0A409VQV5_9AGAR|nr:hypothetical protein CVT26_002935 [Gymnopilus dilepis]
MRRHERQQREVRRDEVVREGRRARGGGGGVGEGERGWQGGGGPGEGERGEGDCSWDAEAEKEDVDPEADAEAETEDVELAAPTSEAVLLVDPLGESVLPLPVVVVVEEGGWGTGGGLTAEWPLPAAAGAPVGAWARNPFALAGLGVVPAAGELAPGEVGDSSPEEAEDEDPFPLELMVLRRVLGGRPGERGGEVAEVEEGEVGRGEREPEAGVVLVVVVGGGVAGRGSPVSWRCLFGEAVIDLHKDVLSMGSWR